MPYIKELQRERLSLLISQIQLAFKFQDIDVGTLNYLITNICKEYIKENGEKYSHYNDIIGVLECVKQELYRRKISKYEDKKIEENGDVY